MKFIYLIAGTYRPAGMERVLAGKANFLASRGNEVAIVTTDQRGRGPAFEMDTTVRCIDLGIDYELTNGRSFLIKTMAYPVKQIRHKVRLTRLLKKEKADVVVSMFCNDASFLPRIKDGSRKVLEIHFSRYKLLQYGRRGLWAVADRLRSRGYGRIASRYDRFVVLTEEDRAYWLEEFPDLGKTICVIPNARTFSPEEFQSHFGGGHLDKTIASHGRVNGSGPSGSMGGVERSGSFVRGAASEMDSSQPNTVLTAGRYSDQKNFADLLKAWAMIPMENRAGWKLRIAGDGELRGDMENLCSSLGIADDVLLGPAADMMAEYAKASIFALSSRYEGLPMVLLEAQASGLPIVSYRCKCGPGDVVSDGIDGYLVPEGDVPALSASLAGLMNDPTRLDAMSEAALKSSERFDADRIMSLWTNLFNKL